MTIFPCLFSLVYADFEAGLQDQESCFDFGNLQCERDQRHGVKWDVSGCCMQPMQLELFIHVTCEDVAAVRA